MNLGIDAIRKVQTAEARIARPIRIADRMPRATRLALHSKARALRLALAGMSVVWACHLACLGILSVDEAEHSHVAWLLSVKGLLPLKDFFQHHMPLYWDVLKLYFVAGGSGPEVLYFGRALAVLFGALFVAGIIALARDRARERYGALVASVLGGITFFSLSFMLPTTIVTRPESLALPLAVWSLVLWARPRGESRSRYVLDVAAGTLMGLAAYTTPRALFIGGTFLILWEGPRDARRFAARAAAFIAGIAAVLVAVPPALGHDYAYLKFAFLFTRSLFQVETNRPDLLVATLSDVARHGAFLQTTLLFLALRLSLLPREHFARLTAHVVNLVVMTATLAAVNPSSFYAYNLFPVLIAATVAVADLAAVARWVGKETFVGIITAGAAIAVTLAAAETCRVALYGDTLQRDVEARRQALALLNPGDKIFLSYYSHPITYPDSSYYGIGIGDRSERFCRLVRQWKHDALPSCDFFATFVTERPRLTDYSLLFHMHRDERPAAETTLALHYRVVTLDPAPGRPGARTLLVRYEK